MAHSTAEEWKINTGNQIVYSSLVDAKRGPMKGHDFHIHDNSQLLPYVGQPGWVIEAPEWASTQDNSQRATASRWIPCAVKATLLWKLLRQDTSLYRARWTQLSRANQRTVLYPDATIRGEDFGWDFSQIVAVLKSSKASWHVERLDVTEDSRLVWSRTNVKSHDWNRDLVCHRLVEV